MLAITCDREWTASQFTGLLCAAGFDIPAVIDTGGPLRIVEAGAG